MSSDERIRTLLKLATQQSKTDLNTAIKTLYDVKILMETSTNYTVEECLRLPLYLQKAGRHDEATLVFEDILSKCRRSPGTNDPFYYGEATVYEKMRLAAKRQGDKSRMVVYAILSHAAECLCNLKRAGDSKKESERVTHLNLPLTSELRKQSYIELRNRLHQEDVDYFNQQNSLDKWKEIVEGAVSKMGYESLSSEILSMCLAFSKKCTRDSIFKLEHSIKRAIEVEIISRKR